MTATETTTYCWFCDDADRSDPPPGGWLLDESHWRAGHAPAEYACAGTVVFESRRHLLDQSEMNAEEAMTYVPTLGRVLHAMRLATSCDRVYQWATMDAFPHFHLWLLPWWTTSETRGPNHLLTAIHRPCDQPDVLTAVNAIRAALGTVSS